MSDKEAKCVPAHGCCISYSVLLLPGLILRDAFDLDFSFLVKYLHFILNIMIFASTFSMFLSAAVISKTRIVFWSLILIFISTPPLFTSHSFLGNISDTSGYILPLGFFLFYLAFTRDVSPIFVAFSYFIILIISFGKPRFYPLSLIALLVPILSYGMKRRVLARLVVPFIAFLVLQAFWSIVIYKNSCKFALISTSPVYQYSSCDKTYSKDCETTEGVYSYTVVKAHELFAYFGLPHPFYYHPASPYICLGVFPSSFPQAPWRACLPEWVYSNDFPPEKWYEMAYHLVCYYDTTLRADYRIVHGRIFTRQVDSLLPIFQKRYPWMPFYRAWRVLSDNIFHPITIVAGPAKSRGRFPLWAKRLYGGYASGYVGLAYILGFVGSLIGLWWWVRGRLEANQRFVFFALAGWGWAPLIGPLVTGHSEWRYFWPGVPFLYFLALYIVEVSFYLYPQFWRRVPWIGVRLGAGEGSRRPE